MGGIKINCASFCSTRVTLMAVYYIRLHDRLLQALQGRCLGDERGLGVAPLMVGSDWIVSIVFN